MNEILSAQSMLLPNVLTYPQALSFPEMGNGKKLVAGSPLDAFQQTLAQVELLPPLSAVDRGRVPTPPLAGQLLQAGMANVTQSLWNTQIQEAAMRNQGFGNSAEGYLAWGIHGFFRYLNDSLPGDLCAQYAAMSLQTGIPIEKLKCSDTYSVEDVAGKSEFAEKFLNSLQKFFSDPSQKFKVDGGGRLYEALQDSKTGQVVFYTYKKSSFASFMKPIMKWLKPVASILKFIPGVNFTVGLAADVATSALDTFSSYSEQRRQMQGLRSLQQ